MNKTLIYSMFAASMMMVACDPAEDRDVLSGAITADDLQITATPQVVDGKNSNYIDLNSDGVGSLTSWDYGNGVATSTKTTVQLLLKGTNEIVFTGLNHDGTYITKTLTVQVDTLINVPEEWGLLCGSGEKIWVWDGTAREDGRIWGNGANRSDSGPGWWGRTLEDIDEETVYTYGANAYMVFSIRGSSLTKVSEDGTLQEKGSFSFDMTQTKESATAGVLWSIGTFTTKNVTVLQGISQNENKIPVYEYDILRLDENKLVLAHRTMTAEDKPWNEAWFWMFRAK